MKEHESLGQAELELLQLVEKLQPVSVRSLVDHLADSSGLARTTILTMVERMRAKGYLTRRKMQGVNHYSSRVPVTQLMQRLVKDFVSGMLGGSVSPFVAYLQNAEALDERELQELRALVDRLESRPAGKSREKRS